MPPLAVITSYVLYAYSAELQLLARQALNTFAILQVGLLGEGLQRSALAAFSLAAFHGITVTVDVSRDVRASRGSTLARHC
jgi:hypothetical protein